MFGGGAEAPGDAPKCLEGGVSFRFNFSVDGENGTGGQGEEQQQQQNKDGEQHRLASSAAATTRPSAPAFEVFPDPIDVGSLQLDAVDLALPSGPLLKVRVAGPSSLHHSDLVPGVYEGGFKLWEGAVDLARLLAEEVIEAATTAEEAEAAPSASSSSPPPVSLVPLDSHLPRWLPGAPRPPSLHGARVLELGCGAALPSLVAAKAATGRGGGTGKGKGKGGERRGPVSVTLCDFNAEVLMTCTAANVAANFPEEGAGAGSAAEESRGEKALFRFFAGDWSNLREALGAAGALPPPSPCSPFSSASPGFDLILAAEVTYSPESYVPLADAIADLLAPPPATSAALVAAKRYYFGVGGNVEGFVESVTRGGRLRVKKVAVVEGPLPRDVLLLTRVQ